MRKIVGIFCIVLAAVLLLNLGITYYPKLMDYKKARDLYNDINDDYTDKSNPEDKSNYDLKSLNLNTNMYSCIDVDGKSLLEKNPDYLGWIYIPETSISYPVVKSVNNEDYLHTNFEKQYNYPGTIFLDCRCEQGILNHHTILYGHNMRDGSMFAGIKSYMDQDFADKHPVFWFITPEYKLLYHIFSATYSDPYDKIVYGIDGVEFKDNDSFETAMNKLKERSSIKTDVTVNGFDYVMTLSTCTNDSVGRCAVSGVLIGGIK